jgi:hypothetical protein
MQKEGLYLMYFQNTINIVPSDYPFEFNFIFRLN